MLVEVKESYQVVFLKAAASLLKSITSSVHMTFRCLPGKSSKHVNKSLPSCYLDYFNLIFKKAVQSCSCLEQEVTSLI